MYFSGFIQYLVPNGVVIVKKYTAPPASITSDYQNPHFCCDLYVHKSTHTDVLSNILATPLLWSIDGTPLAERVTAVGEVWVNHDAYVKGIASFQRLMQSTTSCAEIDMTFEHAFPSQALINTMQVFIAMIDPKEAICKSGCDNLPIQERDDEGMVHREKHVRHLTINMPDGTMEILKMCLHAVCPL